MQEIYREALDNIVELMVDPFGNYLCQKLMEVCTSEQIERIIDAAADQLVSASVSVHGTRTVQKLIEMVSQGGHQLRIAPPSLYRTTAFEPLLR